MRYMPRFCILALACCSIALAAGPSAAELSKSIRDASLDPDQCYRVRDVRLQKEDIKVYLTDGYLIFSKPVAGQRRSAVFTAEVDGGDAEVLLMPPTRESGNRSPCLRSRRTWMSTSRRR